MALASKLSGLQIHSVPEIDRVKKRLRHHAGVNIHFLIVVPDWPMAEMAQVSGLEAEPDSTPEEVRRIITSEVERWTPVIKSIGLQLE
jgi:hypothetical protein